MVSRLRSVFSDRGKHAKRHSERTYRVVLLSGSFYPREGGAERQMRSVLSALAKAGMECHVVTQVVPSTPGRALVLEGIHVHRVGSAWLFRNLPRLAQAIFVVAAFIETLRLRPDRLVSLQFGTASTAASVVAKVLRRPHVVRLTGGGTARFRSEPIARASRMTGRAIVRIICGRRTVVAAPARHLLADFTESFPNRRVETVHVPNAVADPPEGIARSGLPKTVLWYARRGSVTSVELFGEIVRAMPDCNFTIIGGVMDQLSALENAKSLGWVDEPYAVLLQHDVILNTSPHEGSPNMALQALAVGLRVVGFRNAGLKELADDYPGYVDLVDWADTGAIIERLRQTLAKPPGEPQSVPTTSEAIAVWRGLLGSKP